MADEIYFFTRSYSYDEDVAASTPGSSEGTNTPDKTIDKDADTYWETSDAIPRLKIDLGVAQTVDSLWFKHSTNVITYRLYYSTDDITYNPIDVAQNAETNGYTLYLSFSQQTARYWRLDITSKDPGNVLVYECLLMTHRLTLNGDNVPGKIVRVKKDTIGGTYILADGSGTSYAGAKLYEQIALPFDKTSKANRDNLYALFSAPTIRSSLTIYPEPDEYPADIFQMIFGTVDFPLVYHASYTGSGFSGELNFIEY